MFLALYLLAIVYGLDYTFNGDDWTGLCASGEM